MIITTKNKIKAIISYIVLMFITVFVGSWAISYMVSKPMNSEVNIKVFQSETSEVCNVYHNRKHLIIFCDIPEGERLEYNIFLRKEKENYKQLK